MREFRETQINPSFSPPGAFWRANLRGRGGLKEIEDLINLAKMYRQQSKRERDTVQYYIWIFLSDIIYFASISQRWSFCLFGIHERPRDTASNDQASMFVNMLCTYSVLDCKMLFFLRKEENVWIFWRQDNQMQSTFYTDSVISNWVNWKEFKWFSSQYTYQLLFSTWVERKSLCLLLPVYQQDQ